MLTIDRLCMGCMNDNGGEEICPICGHRAGDQNPQGLLPIKTYIKSRYVIGAVLESDGEGVTYIGWDNEGNNIVQIREFFPNLLAHREEKGAIVIDEGKEYLYNTALMDFLQLHRQLEKTDLAALLPTVDLVECNNSAYVIQKSFPGISLREFLLRNGGSLSWEQARPLFMPLVSALESLHKEGIVHGGISPETIMVGRDGRLRLIGFAIAQLRQSGSSVNAQLFPGYAALEQYGVEDGQLLSDSTDVYGFAATLFRVLMGSTLPEATERITDDKMTIPSAVAGRLPKAVLVALANALQILKENRTRSMTELKADIAPAADVTTDVVRVAASQKVTNEPASADNKKPTDTKKKTNENRRYALISAGITAGIFLVIALVLYLVLGKPFASVSTPSSSVPELPSSSQTEPSSVPTTNGEKLLTLPDFSSLGMKFEEICREYPDFKFSVLGKKYSSKAPGIVVGQDIAAGTQVARDTRVYLTLSLGQETVTVPTMTNVLRDAAMIQLFKNGFLYQNITFYEVEDDSVDYNCVVKTDPAAGSTISPDSSITVYISSVKSSDTSTPTSEPGNG